MAGHARSSPASELDSQIDALYQRPLTEFTAARNALAKTLPSAESARVKKLVKPTAIAWVVNQVWWHARSVYDTLLESGEALRAAEIAAIERPRATAKSKRPTVRDATDAHRKATADAVHQATRLSAQANLHPQVDVLTRMLEAISLAPRDAHPHGRFTEVVQPAGFEALFGVQPAPAPAPASKTPPAAPATPQAAKTAARHAAEREQARQKAKSAAIQALAKARAAEREARERAEQAARDLRDAERTVERLRRGVDEAEGAVALAEQRRTAAEAALEAVARPDPNA